MTKNPWIRKYGSWKEKNKAGEKWATDWAENLKETLEQP